MVRSFSDKDTAAVFVGCSMNLAFRSVPMKRKLFSAQTKAPVSNIDVGDRKITI